MSNENVSNEALQSFIQEQPELQAQIVAAYDEKIAEHREAIAQLEAEKKSVTGKSGRGRKSSNSAQSVDTTGNVMKHKEAVLRVLKEPEFRRTGARAGDIKATAKEKYGHEFGKSLGPNLNSMCNDGELAYDENTKGGRGKFVYRLPKTKTQNNQQAAE